MSLRWVYGPVPSRRFGRSLGVSTIPFKTCNYSCVYCQLGRTINMTNRRREFFPKEELLEEIREGVKRAEEGIDYITFVGDGEPTLYTPLEYLIDEVKEAYSFPISVITNGSLFYSPLVREEVSGADVISPTVDTAVEMTWKKINRPHRDLVFEEVLEGLLSLRDEYSGEIWVEVMLVDGLNDSEEELQALKEYFGLLKPERVYINIPIRPPAESWVRPPSPEALFNAHRLLNGLEITALESGEFVLQGDDPIGGILRILLRHPMREEQIESTLKSWGVEDARAVMEVMKMGGAMVPVEYRGRTYYLPGRVRREKKAMG